jgi:hypothetical protein
VKQFPELPAVGNPFKGDGENELYHWNIMGKANVDVSTYNLKSFDFDKDSFDSDSST